MRKIAMIAAVAALASAPQAASAADLGGGSMKDVPPPVMITNWTGFYGSIGVGFGAVVNDYQFNDEWVPAGVPIAGFYDQWNTGGDGILGTIQLGYDYQFPASRWLIGAFVDYDWENFSSTHDETFTFFGVPAPVEHDSATLENQWSIGGRLGVLTSPETMLYALFAYSQGQEKVSRGYWVSPLTAIAYAGFDGTATLDGWSVGTGLETHLKDNWFLKLEYRFSALSSDTAYDVNPFLVEHVWGSVDADVHTARLSLTYKLSRQGLVEPLK